MQKIILASTSPRRKQIMTEMGLEFEIVPPLYDENILGKKFSYGLIESIAENKAVSASKRIDYPAVVVSADTVVVHDEDILGKPKDYNEAKTMLSLLNGDIHKVVTSVCIINTLNGNKTVQSETSYVEFNKLTEEELKSYITEFRPYDKAGSYGIQELPSNFVKRIEGEYNNIVGLPDKLLKKMLKEIT